MRCAMCQLLVTSGRKIGGISTIDAMLRQFRRPIGVAVPSSAEKSAFARPFWGWSATRRHSELATVRPDGWPQATTVGYVNEGLTLYFLCGLRSQKAQNLALNNRVSLTIDHDTDNIMAITGLSMAARASAVTDRAEAEKILRMLPLKYPEQSVPLPGPMPTPEQVALFRITPIVISVLDYSKGFGHTDLVTCA
jgi:nitroimidazol reductase NimA-like FMN-containing flavoprotein (pyridoxamine 5'-phosphate oxidase superfamily)